ncbi:MAG: hypothetical protein JNM63_19780, partial [Spirochaetia bacterium]|nr:hypothetical protein [Spirochaetia bacterium]
MKVTGILLLSFLLGRAWSVDVESNISSHLEKSLDIQYYTGYERNPLTVELGLSPMNLSLTAPIFFPDFSLGFKLGDLKNISLSANLSLASLPPRSEEERFGFAGRRYATDFSLALNWLSQTRMPAADELTITKSLYPGHGIFLVDAFAEIQSDPKRSLWGLYATKSIKTTTTTTSGNTTTTTISYSSESHELSLAGPWLEGIVRLRLGLTKFAELSLSYDANSQLGPGIEDTVTGPYDFNKQDSPVKKVSWTNLVDSPFLGV